jgi:hypothetical protein
MDDVRGSILGVWYPQESCAFSEEGVEARVHLRSVVFLVGCKNCFGLLDFPFNIGYVVLGKWFTFLKGIWICTVCNKGLRRVGLYLRGTKTRGLTRGVDWL